ncbi:MAG: acyl-CoA dehydratase activase-related protein [Anaerotignum sp.]
MHKKGEETGPGRQQHDRYCSGRRAYHADPEINHGIPELIAGYNIAVLTEDSVAHMGHLTSLTVVRDQWNYHSRLYEAAASLRNRKTSNMYS